MPLIIFNISIGLGVLLIAIGSCAQWGWPIGFMVTGVSVIILTFLALQLAAANAKG